MKPDYGIDAPKLVRNMALLGAGCVVAAIAAPPLRFFVYPAISFLGTAGTMVLGSKVGKLRARDQLLDRLKLRGDENVLDIGCGRGLLLIGAARRLTTGQAIGIDLWQGVDQSGNSRAATMKNVQRESVEERVDLLDADARSLPFEADLFDVVISSWAIHNIPDAAGRERAIREAARVLKPGGRLAIMDIQYAREYAAVLTAAGLSDVHLSAPSFLFVIPTRTVTARKPA